MLEYSLLIVTTLTGSEGEKNKENKIFKLPSISRRQIEIRRRTVKKTTNSI